MLVLSKEVLSEPNVVSCVLPVESVFQSGEVSMARVSEETRVARPGARGPRVLTKCLGAHECRSPCLACRIMNDSTPVQAQKRSKLQSLVPLFFKKKG